MDNNRLALYPNPEGIIYKTEINDKCTNCGACIGFCDIFEDTSTGKPYLKNCGIVNKDEIDGIRDAAEICPTSAITYGLVSTVNSNKKTTIEELLGNLKREFSEYTFPAPDFDNFKQKIWIHIDCTEMVSYYNYYSYESAQDAGLEALDNKYFKKADAICTEELSTYKNLKLKPLLEYKDEPGNYYYEEQQKVNNYLYILLSELKKITGYDFISNREIYPVKLYNVSKKTSFAEFEKKYHYLCQDVESKNWYKSYIDVDSMDTLVESGIFKSKYKEKTMYSYNICEALQTIEKHISDYSERNLKEALESAWNSQKYDFYDYERKLQELVKEICKYCEKL